MFVGTSMSAGKTTTARIATRRLKRTGADAPAAEGSGAGRYEDAGADWGFEFVDAGLPSTVVPEAECRSARRHLLSRMARQPAEGAVVEIGAPPLEKQS